jgi:hypothetical protein
VIDLTSVEWRKSSRSGAYGDNCVEVAFADDDGGGFTAAVGERTVLVRDSKSPGGPVLTFTAGEWNAFVAGARDGEFDL